MKIKEGGVMDIQKKREAFEKLSEIAEILKNKTIKFVEKTNKYYSYHYSVEYLNGAWMAWQAKAQAVPEGFLLMPRKCTNKMAHAAKAVDGRLSAFKYADVYDAMVEAQEPAND